MNSKTVKEACRLGVCGMYVQRQVNSPGAQREFLTLFGFSGKQLGLKRYATEISSNKLMPFICRNSTSPLKPFKAPTTVCVACVSNLLSNRLQKC